VFRARAIDRRGRDSRGDGEFGYGRFVKAAGGGVPGALTGAMLASRLPSKPFAIRVVARDGGVGRAHLLEGLDCAVRGSQAEALCFTG